MAGQTTGNPKQGDTGTISAIESLRNEIILMRKDFEYLRSDITETKQDSEKKVEDANKMIKDLRITLYGNGNVEQPGLVTIVSKIQDWIDDRKFYERMLVGLLITESIGVLFLAARVFLGL